MTTLRALLGALVLCGLALGATPTAAQTDDAPPPTFENTIPVQGPRIVTEPNSGQVPTYEGQRGTASQFAVLGAILVGLTTIVLLVVRDSRRKRAAGGGQPRPATRSSTRSEPVADTSVNQPDSTARQ